MKDILSKNYIKDGEIIETDNIIGFDDTDKTVIYEVIRVINRIGVFIEDHLSRLYDSLKAANIDVPDKLKDIKYHIRMLGETNEVYNFSVKIVIAKDNDGSSHYGIYIMKSFYPDKAMIDNGIHAEYMEWERINPNTKTVNSGFKDTAALLMEKYNAFELLLVNRDGFITEGSRTNVFFVIGDKLFTAPSKYILKGITRKYVLQACERVGLKVFEELLNKEAIKNTDGAFICGTSLKVLPIVSIGNVKLSSPSNELVRKVIKEYDKIMDEYIINHN